MTVTLVFAIHDTSLWHKSMSTTSINWKRSSTLCHSPECQPFISDNTTPDIVKATKIFKKQFLYFAQIQKNSIVFRFLIRSRPQKWCAFQFPSIKCMTTVRFDFIIKHYYLDVVYIVPSVKLIHRRYCPLDLFRIVAVSTHIGNNLRSTCERSDDWCFPINSFRILQS